MNIEQVIKKLKKIDGSRDIWWDIIKAFAGYSFNGISEVAIESQSDNEIVQAFIDTEGAPVIEIALDQWADGSSHMVITPLPILIKKRCILRP